MPRRPIIAIVNHSTVLTDEEVQAALPALQHQIDYHFEPHWNAGGRLLHVETTGAGAIHSDGVGGLKAKHTAAAVVGELPAGAWLITITDDSDVAGALGYHDVDPRQTPIGFVFAKTDQDAGLSWTVTLSHELLEMLGDPLAVLTVPVKADGTCLAYETADAVEADGDGYEINGVLVSNFVYPNWFVQGSPGPWDHRGLLKAPLELRPGGYIGVWRPGKGWTQVTAQDVPHRLADDECLHVGAHGASVISAAGERLLDPIPGPRHEAGPRFRQRAEGTGRNDHAAGDLPAWLEA